MGVEEKGLCRKPHNLTLWNPGYERGFCTKEEVREATAPGIAAFVNRKRNDLKEFQAFECCKNQGWIQIKV